MLKKTASLFIPSLLCLSVANALAQTPITTAILAEADNFRDLAGIAAQYGGTGYTNTTRHDGVMRSGVFFRSNALSTLTSSDKAALNALGISSVIDLRTVSEVNGAPEAQNVPPGAKYQNIDILGGSSGTLPPLNFISSAVSIAYMESINKSFVADAGERAELKKVFIELASTPGAAVYNCTAGKDRTGFVSAALELMAGVSSDVVMQNYLATNLYTATRVDATMASLIGSQGPGFAAIYAPLLGVEASYLQASFDEISSLYGEPGDTITSGALNLNYNAFNRYLMQGLGLTQADIYVLRAKMVDYQSLPGQSGLRANAASGAAFLAALQNSPLSGAYTNYNQYLQSAIDSGNLGGVERRVGGQLHADAQSYLLRQGSFVEEASADYVSGDDLKPGQTKVWEANLGRSADNNGRTGVEDSSERDFGLLVGLTHRVNERVSANAGLGYRWGRVDTTGARADIDTFMLTLGGRMAFADFDQGPYVAAQLNAGWADYSSTRSIGANLGSASGSSHGSSIDARFDLGYVIQQESLQITPKIGLRFSRATLAAFDESGSELALQVEGFRQNNTSVLAGVDFKWAERNAGDFVVAPVFNLDYEHANHSRVTSQASLYGINVAQDSAADNRNLLRAGVGIVAKRKNMSIQAGLNTAYASSHSEIGGKLSFTYQF